MLIYLIFYIDDEDNEHFESAHCSICSTITKAKSLIDEHWEGGSKVLHKNEVESFEAQLPDLFDGITVETTHIIIRAFTVEDTI